MSRQPESKAVERSCRFYRRLLFVYPKAHREEYGAAILQLFRDQCRDAWAEESSLDLIGFWLRAIADLLKTSILEHFSYFSWSRIMPTSFRPTIKPLWAFIPISGLIFLFILATTALITFIYPEAFASAARVLVDAPVANASPSNPAQTEALVVSSTAVVEKTVQALNLQAVWGKKYNNGGLLTVSDCVALLKSRLEVSALKPNVLQIRAFSDDAEEAAKLANGVVEAYRDYRKERDIQAGGAPDVRGVTILDQAVPIHRPVRPNKPLNIMMGGLAGIFLGSIIASIVLGIVASIRKKSIPPRIPQNA